MVIWRHEIGYGLGFDREVDMTGVSRSLGTDYTPAVCALMRSSSGELRISRWSVFLSTIANLDLSFVQARVDTLGTNAVDYASSLVLDSTKDIE